LYTANAAYYSGPNARDFSNDLMIAADTTAQALNMRFLINPTQTNPEAFRKVMLSNPNPNNGNVVGIVFYDPAILATTQDAYGLTTPIRPDLNVMRLPTNSSLPGNANFPPIDRIVGSDGYELVCPYMIYWESTPAQVGGTNFNNSEVHYYIENLVNQTNYGGRNHEALILCDKTRATQEYYELPSPSQSTTWFSQFTAIHYFGRIFMYRTGGIGIGNTFFHWVEYPSRQYVRDNANPKASTISTPSNGDLIDAINLVAMGRISNVRLCNSNDVFKSQEIPNCGYRILIEDWERGTSGWGSPMWNGPTVAGGMLPASCRYQQDALSVYDTVLGPNWRIAEIQSAAADLFLNWASNGISSAFTSDQSWGAYFEYDRANGQNPPPNNIVLSCTSTGTTGSGRYVGEARSLWMETVVMPSLSSYFP
jgi:hypothetical protein